MKGFSVCLLALAAATSFAQGTISVGAKDKAQDVRAYEAHRFQVTEPSFGIAKVHALFASKSGKEGFGDPYKALTVPEKFTYCMLRGEGFDQNCAGMPLFESDPHRIFAELPMVYFDGEFMWSDRQIKFLQSHHSQVVDMLRKTIDEKGQIGINLKQGIVVADGFELIPEIVATYEKDGNDHDLLTVLCLLMQQGKYKPFLKTSLYKQLYGSKDFSYKSSVEASFLNQGRAIKLAMAYYNSRSQ